MFIDYLYTHPNAKLRFHKSDMQLHIESDAAYLVSPGAKSTTSGYFHISNSVYNNSPPPLIYAPVQVECQLLKHVVTSAEEAETGTVFHNCKISIGINKMIQALGKPQGTTPLKTDNPTEVSCSNATLKENPSKTGDMRWYFLQD